MSIENYHLKWDAHQAHLNSSIATLYRNEKFADVMLYSSNLDCNFPRVGVPAHKFILSSSSQFFGSIFDCGLISASNSGVFHIVLPPDLTQRTIQILVQYMYSGEATVPNDILSEVLRGGELLRIRGLCRSSTQLRNGNHDHQKTYFKKNILENSNYSCYPSTVQGMGVSVLPEDSPVVIKTPKQSQTQAGLLKITNCNNSASGITINKNVAIDPDPGEENYTLTESNDNIHTSVPASCRESGCRGCVNLNQIERISPDTEQLSTAPIKSTLRSNSQSAERAIPENVTYRRVSLPVQINTPNEAISQCAAEQEITCYQIKEEPSDGWQIDQSTYTESTTPKDVPQIIFELSVPRDNIPPPIKIETPTSEDDKCTEPLTDDSVHVVFTHLECDICKETFDEPKSWDEHTQSHSDKPQTSSDPENSSNFYNEHTSKAVFLPKKRRRFSPQRSPDAHVTLTCDLCSTSFSAPGEWVRHINTCHTELELARFNNQRNTTEMKTTAENIAMFNKISAIGGLYKT